MCANPEDLQQLRVKRNVDHGPWIIMTGPCRLVSCSQCAHLVRDVDDGRMEAGREYRATHVLTYFAVTLTAQKKKIKIS